MNVNHVLRHLDAVAVACERRYEMPEDILEVSRRLLFVTGYLGSPGMIPRDDDYLDIDYDATDDE